MKIRLFIALTLLFGVAAAQSPRLGVVNLDRIIRESAPAVTAARQLEAEFGPQEKEIEDMVVRFQALGKKIDRDGAVLAASELAKLRRDATELERTIQRKRNEFREDLTARRNEELAVLLEKANRIVQELAKREKYDIIFQENIVYADSSLDITELVIRALADGK